MNFKQDTLERQQTKLVIQKAKELPHGQFEAVLSTEDIDRHGEIVSIKGIQVPKDQVIKMYYNHQTNGDALPIGKWLKIWKKNGVLMGLGEVDLEDDFALKVYKKVKNGFIDSISIGFYPQEYDGETATWTKSTLVEASVVAEPANTSAKITSKELGFTQEEFEQSLTVKLKQAEESSDEEDGEEEATVEVKQIVKGAVQDVLTTPSKYKLMRPYYDVVSAFEQTYYKSTTPTTDFKELLDETISLLKKISNGTYDLTKDAGNTSGANIDPEMKSAVEELKSRIGAVEEAVKGTTDNPAINLIKVRVAAKQVDQAAEELNKTLKVKLKETN